MEGRNKDGSKSCKRVNLVPDEEDYKRGNDDDDDKGWFYSTTEYIDFSESLKGMISEEEQEKTRKKYETMTMEKTRLMMKIRVYLYVKMVTCDTLSTTPY